MRKFTAFTQREAILLVIGSLGYMGMLHAQHANVIFIEWPLRKTPMAQRWRMLETEPPEDRLRRQLQELEEEVCQTLPLMHWPHAKSGMGAPNRAPDRESAPSLYNMECSAATKAPVARVFGGISLLIHESSLRMP